MRKRILCLLFFISQSIYANPGVITIRHINDGFGMGRCVYVLQLATDDWGGTDFYHKLNLKLALVAANGKLIHQGEVSLAKLGSARFDHKASVYFEEPTCKTGTKLEVLAATANYGKDHINLLKAKLLKHSTFKPLPIQIG